MSLGEFGGFFLGVILYFWNREICMGNYVGGLLWFVRFEGWLVYWINLFF